MKAYHWFLPSLLMTILACSLWFGTARADGPRAQTAWEYKHVLIPLDRKLDTYERNDRALLAPIQKLGAEGWELISANEPSNGVMVDRRASVEFWFKRPVR
jgi:hypothetical protein